MPLDPAVLERKFIEFEFPIERGKIREYAMALGLTDKVHTDVKAARAAGYVDLVAPPTFTRQFWYDTDENDPMRHLGIDVARRLLGEYRFEYHKPVVAGMVLRCRNRIIDTKEKKGRRGGTMTFVIIETRLYDNSTGELVQVDYRTLIETEVPPKK